MLPHARNGPPPTPPCHRPNHANSRKSKTVRAKTGNHGLKLTAKLMSTSIGYVNTNPTSSSASGASGQTLDQADFLQLLVTQMSSQDPLNPESDTDFAAQLAQFSALQEAQDTQGDLQDIQATGLIGQNVTVNPSSGASAVTGVVTAVQISSGTPSIIVNNQPYTLSQLSAVTPAGAATPSNGNTSSGTPSTSTPSSSKTNQTSTQE